MCDIRNPKIGFKHFPGFSLLFDNPGRGNLSPLCSRFLQVNAQVKGNDTKELTLYKELKKSLDEIKSELRHYLFFELPVYSYHVTVWDGLNNNNKEAVFEHYHPALTEFLLNLPTALLEKYCFTTMAESSSLVKFNDWIFFKFKELHIWGSTVLVARLQPVDEDSKKALEQIETNRRKLYEKFKTQFGLEKWMDYVPHVSLGYFGNKQKGEEAQDQLKTWNNGNIFVLEY
jgi:hypothetical protein